jgi:hypothetical protein
MCARYIMQCRRGSLTQTSFALGSVAGAVFVATAFKQHLQSGLSQRLPSSLFIYGRLAHLEGTEWSDPEVIARAVTHFDQNAKRKVSLNPYDDRSA